MPRQTNTLPTQPLSETQRDFLIRPFIIETDPQETHEQPHRHNFQEILWVRSGRGKHVIDGRELTIQPNTFYLIAKGQVHQLITGINLDGLVIRFTDAFLPNFLSQEIGHYQTVLFNNVTINHTLPAPPDALPKIEKLLGLLLAEFDSADGRSNQEVLRHLLTVLLIKLGKVQKEVVRGGDTAVSPEAQLFYEFTLLLEAQYSQTHAVQDYARQLNISPRQLSDITRSLVGQTAKHLIEERLLLEARRLLTFTNLSIKEIAHKLGYKDPSHFSKIFKKKTNATPQSYKTA